MKPKAFKVEIKPFVVVSTSKERIEQEIRDFLNEELMYAEPPDSPVEIVITET